MEIPAKYEVVIGLEVHAQLQTRSKIFCGDSTAFGAAPNTQVSPISLAHPGTLPKMNAEVITHAVKLGLALDCEIQSHNYFARKNYFYPDLPKGYQVTQHTSPVCTGGFINVGNEGEERKIRLNRIHMEEDAGKSLHDADPDYTCIDLNRAGVPLLEIVSEPDLRSGDEAYAYLVELRRMVRWLEVCDGNMEEGSMRCDANISIRLKGDPVLGTRVEVKNLNSIRNVKRAIEIEAVRLAELVERGKEIVQETRSYDADKNNTFSLRSKEEAHDYRYFPEPDLPPFLVTTAFINEIRHQLPTLPAELKTKFSRDYSLGVYDADQMTTDRETALFFESLVSANASPKSAANWIQGPLRIICAETKHLSSLPVKRLAELINLAETGVVSFQAASTRLLNAMLQNPDSSPLEIATEMQLLQESGQESLEAWVDEVLAKLPEKVKEYRSGKKALLGMFAGEVKKLSKGKADMQTVNEILSIKLNQ